MRDPAGNRRVAFRHRPRPVVDWAMLVPGGGVEDIACFLFFLFLLWMVVAMDTETVRLGEWVEYPGPLQLKGVEVDDDIV